MRPQEKVASALMDAQGGFPSLPFTPGVLSTPQATPPYYGFEPPKQERTPTISSYQPDLKTMLVDALMNAVTGKYPGSQAAGGLFGQVTFPYLGQKLTRQEWLQNLDDELTSLSNRPQPMSARDFDLQDEYRRLLSVKHAAMEGQP